MSSPLISQDFPRSTMSSLEIAESCEKQHDNVKRTIETLVERDVFITPPQIEEKASAGRLVEIYHITKRDTLVVAAQLSPQFTARVVDRWMELEAQEQSFDPSKILEDPIAMRGLLLSYTEVDFFFPTQKR